MCHHHHHESQIQFVQEKDKLHNPKNNKENQERQWAHTEDFFSTVN